MENAMPITLPKPVEDYLTADRAKDPELFARCFAADARVHDEDNDYRGIDEIVAWKRASMAKFQYPVEPLDAAAVDDTVTLRARVSGNFPNSPVELEYTFTLASEK